MTYKWRRWAVPGIAALVLCLFAGAWVFWRAQRTLNNAESGLANARTLALDVGPVPSLPNPGFEAVSSPASFRSAAALEGRSYLAGPAGLFAYSPDGTLEKIYRPGLDYPATTLGAMQVGTLADSKSPELLIATSSEGILAFDGQHFRQIRAKQPEARAVTALLPLGSGRLLIGTAKLGLLLYDGKSLTRFHTTTDNQYVTALAGSEAELWVGTLDHGLLHWRGGQTEALTEAEGLPDPRIESIVLDGDRVFAGTPVGVAEIRGGKVARVLAPGRYAKRLLVLNSELLVGQGDGGILHLPLDAASTQIAPRRAIKIAAESPSRTTGDPVEQLLTIDGTAWAVTAKGLQRASDQSAEIGAGGHLLSDGNVSSILLAADGRLWIGYFDHGLDILSSAAPQSATLHHIEDEHIFCVNRITEDPAHGTVAVATANGLVIFSKDGTPRQTVTHETGLIANHVTDVAVLGAGMVAATPAGITFLDDSGAHSLYAFQGLVNNHVYALGLRPGQQATAPFLVGTLGGISQMAAEAVARNLTTANSGLKANWITGLVPIGADWLVGTYGSGVERLDSAGQVTTTDATKNGVVVNPLAMAADNRLVLAGTLGQGLLVGDATGTRWHTVLGGLPSANVTAVAIDKGIVYVGTDNGLVRISEDKL